MLLKSGIYGGILALLFTTATWAESGLTGTSWQLSSIQSMDDAQGTFRLRDPGRVTVNFGLGGRVSFKLDCNSGTGTYQARAQTRTSGSLTFGPIASTRMACPPPHLDARIARDMQYVRSYLIKNGKLYLALMADGGIYEWLPLARPVAPQELDRRIEAIRFNRGPRVEINGQLKGRQYVDYQFVASAGQKIKVGLKASNRATYFNLLPPGSENVGMVLGEFNNNQFEGLLPDDGRYTIRVFLFRNAARRGEISNFNLKLQITGNAYLPLSNARDARIKGTRYHASSTVNCQPAYSQMTRCEAMVVRRQNNSATVEIRWNQGSRRILFIRGEPAVADTPGRMRVTKDDRGWRIQFEDQSSVQIPYELVNGG